MKEFEYVGEDFPLELLWEGETVRSAADGSGAIVIESAAGWSIYVPVGTWIVRGDGGALTVEVRA